MDRRQTDRRHGWNPSGCCGAIDGLHSIDRGVMYGQDGTGRLVSSGWLYVWRHNDDHNINNTDTILTLVMAGGILSCVPTVCTVLGKRLDMWRLEGELTEKWRRERSCCSPLVELLELPLHHSTGQRPDPRIKNEDMCLIGMPAQATSFFVPWGLEGIMGIRTLPDVESFWDRLSPWFSIKVINDASFVDRSMEVSAVRWPCGVSGVIVGFL